ncbi:uncharacterized protein LTR77_005055 [Saxophila tyrrhenica]|uniref:Uncharacterized protein n=1 Tax=Saxophila tyrrhenica TaxID=1690608 RepID=A0AAV9PEA1_9PEZI|nr:hypothetical protein LTR77_005055 [Saxophila tyrrhenica]
MALNGRAVSLSQPARSRRLLKEAVRPRYWQKAHARPLSTLYDQTTAGGLHHKPSRYQPTFWKRARSQDGNHFSCGRRYFSGIGSEPGIDTKTDASSSHEEPESQVKIIDFSKERLAEQDVATSSLQTVLSEQPKPDWAACRWIYVNGLNRNVVRLIGDHKKLHRLSLEDVMDTNTPTKVDWYDNHCFLELTLQKLVRLENYGEGTSLLSTDATALLDESLKTRRAKWRTLAHRKSAISVEQVSMFLTSDNIVITLFEHSGPDVLKPIMTRLNSPQTIVRSSNDPSMLVQAVIDVVVDMSVPINKAVGDMFGELESAVLSNPTITQSKQLYVLRSGLTLLMDNIRATGGLVRTLIDHRAVLNTTMSGADSTTGNASPQAANTSVHISATTQVYLQDVQDHITALSNSTHNSIRSAENLTSLIFNTIAASQNESVRQLTLVSSFFLPLTFLTGYFGMNFDPMPIVNEHSDKVFWLIAIPVMLVTGTLLVGARIVRLRPRSFSWRRRARQSDRVKQE